MFDILATIVGSCDDEARILDFAREMEACVVRAGRLGIAVEVRDGRLAKIIRRRALLPDGADGGRPRSPSTE